MGCFCIKKVPKKKKINKNLLNDYRILENIGSGHFGLVNIVERKYDGKIFAMKMDRKCNVLDKEVNLLKKIKHNSIIRMEEYYKNDGHVYIIMDYYPDGDLFYYMEKKNNISEYRALKIIKNLLKPIKVLNNYFFCHLDIKPENYLVRSNYDFVLTDFGSVSFFNCDALYRTNRYLGTKTYAAPEIFSKYYCNKSDIWSIGIILYILIKKETVNFLLFTQEGINSIINKLDVNVTTKHILRSCLVLNNKHRISLNDLINKLKI